MSDKQQGSCVAKSEKARESIRVGEIKEVRPSFDLRSFSLHPVSPGLDRDCGTLAAVI